MSKNFTGLQNHVRKQKLSIQNKLFDLLVDLDDENAHGYPNVNINLLIKYYIIQKIFVDKNCSCILNNENIQDLEFELGKNKDNKIIILSVNKYIRDSQNLLHHRDIKDFTISDNTADLINKRYKMNYTILHQYIQQNMRNCIQIIGNNTKNKEIKSDIKLKSYNNINKYNNKTLKIVHNYSINSHYIKEFVAHNSNSHDFHKIKCNYYDYNVDPKLIGDKTENAFDRSRSKWLNYNNNNINNINDINNDGKLNEHMININQIDPNDEIKIKPYIDINQIKNDMDIEDIKINDICNKCNKINCIIPKNMCSEIKSYKNKFKVIHIDHKNDNNNDNTINDDNNDNINNNNKNNNPFIDIEKDNLKFTTPNPELTKSQKRKLKHKEKQDILTAKINSLQEFIPKYDVNDL